MLRYRDGTFDPVIMAKRQRRLSDVDAGRRDGSPGGSPPLNALAIAFADRMSAAESL